MNEQKIFLTSIRIYPVKSCQGIKLEKTTIGSRGPAWDRHWMIVDTNGNFLSQRKHPKMALIKTKLEHESLVLSIPEHKDFRFSLEPNGSILKVKVWKDFCFAIDLGEKAANLFSEFLGLECRLVFMPSKTKRKINPKYALQSEDVISFADGYPFLLISEASLDNLNQRLEIPVSMDRFRPNLVVSGCNAFEEDTWKKIRIGEVFFDIVKPCSRCLITCVNQQSGKKGIEPLKTLAGFRKQKKGIMFGQYLIHTNQGTFSEGDHLKIIQ